jgi:hypothetical protein
MTNEKSSLNAANESELVRKRRKKKKKKELVVV